MSNLDNERRIVKNISARRQELGLSYEKLATLMRSHGSRVTASALYKTEKGVPPRRLTIDDLIAATHALQLDIADALGSSFRLETHHVHEALEDLTTAGENAASHIRSRDSLVQKTCELVERMIESHPDGCTDTFLAALRRASEVLTGSHRAAALPHHLRRKVDDTVNKIDTYVAIHTV